MKGASVKHHIRWLIIVLLISGFSLWVSLPDTRLVSMPDYCQAELADLSTKQGIHLDFDGDCAADFTLNVQQSLGLDLVGGLRVLLRADLPPSAYTVEDLQQTANNVSRRIDALGVSESTIQVLQSSGRILIELPGVSDPEQAVGTLQQTALLEFVDFSGINVLSFVGQRIMTTEQQAILEQRGTDPTPDPDVLMHPSGGAFTTVMTGAGLQAAAAQTDGLQWFISFELNREGSQVFGPYTAQNIGQPMAIVLDGVVLSAPTIQAELTSGGVIDGSFTRDDAQQLALQLRSGALSIPLSVESTEQVGASLGQVSIDRSIRAGIIGVIVVLSFMLIYYRVPGIAADLALLVFIAMNFAFFKLVPVTLTLPAITGFLIGIGTAVDGNILIFERIKEELRAGKDLDEALKAGFDRAWTSIRDSNLSTIIICVILFMFGQTPGASIVSGFAVTLALSMVVNLFTATIVTRTFLHLIVAATRSTLSSRKWLLGV